MNWFTTRRAAWAVSLCPVLAYGQDPSGEKALEIRRLESPPVIDGVIDEEVWSRAALIDDLHQVEPVEYAQPSQRTEIRLYYDDDALYVAARLFDTEADRITANVLRQGEGLANDDGFTIILDPYLDRRSGYRFRLNPNGVRWEALYEDTSSLESNWDGIWRGAATRDAAGWTAEMAIPFKTVSFNAASDTWGINFERAVQRNGETIGWVSRNRQLNPGVAGTMSSLTALKQGRGLDVVPSVSAGEQKTYGADAASSTNLEPSLDIFYKVTPSLNAALTINTDFSATEVDDRQVNLTRFNLFFPEKRDFFLQDADIFEFGRIGQGPPPGGGGGGGGGGGPMRGLGQNGQPFFSRSLGLSESGEPVDLNYGGKLSGRAGRWNIGTLAVQQAADGDIEETDIFVGRVAANVLAESALGVIFTDGDPHSNLDSSTVGTDFRYRNTRLPGGRVLQAETWYQETDTEGLSGDDAAYGFGIGAPNNTGWRGGFSMRHIEDNFDPAVGFVNERGVRGHHMDFGYRHRYRDRYLNSIFGNVEAMRIERIDTGALDREEISTGIELDNTTLDNGVFRLSRRREILTSDFEIYEPPDGSGSVVIPPGDYAWDEVIAGLSTASYRTFSAFALTRSGEYYDGEHTEIRTNLQWRPSAKFSLRLTYSRDDISLPAGDFIVRLSTITVQYAFSSTLSWVNLIQYDNVSENIGVNSRIHWIPQAGREGFIVLNHNLVDTDRNDSFHSTSADVTVKFSYTWRF